MTTLRRALVLLSAIAAGLFFANAIFHWLIGLDGPVLLLPYAVFAALFVSWARSDARQIRPYTAHEHRDAILGWGALLGAIATGVCFALPWPWELPAALAVATCAFFAVRALAGPPPTGPGARST